MLTHCNIREHQMDQAQTDTPTVSTKDNVILSHAAGIKTAWNKQVSSIIETGQLLLQAKKEMSGTGKWLKLFDPRVGDLPFGADTAERLMKIARHKVLSDSAHGRNLPPSWRTLHVLSKATPKQLEKWIADGSVNAETERKQAEALVSPKKKSAKAKAGENDLDGSDDNTDSDDAITSNSLDDDDMVQLALENLFMLASDAAADWTNVDFNLVSDLIEQLQIRLNAAEAMAAEAEAWATVQPNA
jgi:hypothetical protein